MINHKPLDLFEFRKLQHLLKILSYCTSDFESRKVQGSWDWHGFGGLEVLWPKRPILANFFVSTTFQVLKLHQQLKEILKR
jgi:hypothetical protein